MLVAVPVQQLIRGVRVQALIVVQRPRSQVPQPEPERQHD